MDHDEQQMEIIENLTEELGEKELIIMKQEKEIKELMIKQEKEVKELMIKIMLYRNHGDLIFGDHECVLETLENDVISVCLEKTHWNDYTKKEFLKLFCYNQFTDWVGDDIVDTEQNIRDYIEEEYDCYLAHTPSAEKGKFNGVEEEYIFIIMGNGEPIEERIMEIIETPEISIEYLYHLPWTNKEGEKLFICIY